MSEWMPIETAPKGRKLLAGWYQSNGIWRTVTARYYPKGTLDWGEDFEGDDDDGYAPEGWYEESETQDNILAIKCLTHWMPIPDPPSAP